MGDNLEVCADCLIVAVNGDTSGIESALRLGEILNGLYAYAESGKQLVPGADTEGSFSWQPCDLCGSGLGGDRFEMVGI